MTIVVTKQLGSQDFFSLPEIIICFKGSLIAGHMHDSLQQFHGCDGQQGPMPEHPHIGRVQVGDAGFVMKPKPMHGDFPCQYNFDCNIDNVRRTSGELSINNKYHTTTCRYLIRLPRRRTESLLQLKATQTPLRLSQLEALSNVNSPN